jgi:hypothetical protein
MALIRRLRTADPFERGVYKLAGLCVLLILLCSALGIGLSAVARANRAQTGVQGSCQFWRDLSNLPLTKTSSVIAFTIVADSRIAYVTQDCADKFGKLQKPDPRVLPYLPPGMR